MLTFLVVLALGAVQPSDDPFVIEQPAAAAEATQPAAPEPEQVTAPAAAPSPSRQRLICSSRPVLGSRVVTQRTCKTAEEWAIYDNDLEQSRRDIADRGARGCDMRRSPEC